MATTKRTSTNNTSSSTSVNIARGNARTRRVLRTQPRALAFAVGVAIAPWTLLNPAYAQIAATTLPTGGTVAAGTASISTSGSNMQVTQSSNSAILNWQTFSIGSSAWVNFAQPSSSALARNRVTGRNPSEVYGRLTADGQVFCCNPSGILRGRSASVDVGNLCATALSIKDQDFLSGNYSF